MENIERQKLADVGNLLCMIQDTKLIDCYTPDDICMDMAKYIDRFHFDPVRVLRSKPLRLIYEVCRIRYNVNMYCQKYKTDQERIDNIEEQVDHFCEDKTKRINRNKVKKWLLELCDWEDEIE